MDAEDAPNAVSSGANALIVSNHGERQLDGAPSSIATLPTIGEAVGNDIEIWMDGGIRSGQDVLKAIALGARATMSPFRERPHVSHTLGMPNDVTELPARCVQIFGSARGQLRILRRVLYGSARRHYGS